MELEPKACTDGLFVVWYQHYARLHLGDAVVVVVRFLRPKCTEHSLITFTTDTIRVPSHQASESVCVNAAMTLATQSHWRQWSHSKWDATPFLSDSIVVNETVSQASLHWRKLTLTLKRTLTQCIQGRPHNGILLKHSCEATLGLRVPILRKLVHLATFFLHQ